MRLQTYIDQSIALLRRAEKIALRMSDKGFYLAFSGGCLFCPMATLNDIRRMERRYPKYRAAFIRLIRRLRANGWCSDFAHKTDEQLFEP